MRTAIIFFSIIFLSLQISGQTKNSVFLNLNSIDYTTTDFSKVDSLSCWFYVLTDKSPYYIDSIKPIGQLILQRTHPIDDKLSEELYKTKWLPNFTFQIFDIKDSSYCFRLSKLARTASSCVGPDLGGDIVMLDKFIFVNISICLSCKKFDNGVDYCRPIINKIFSGVHRTKAITLKEIAEQFPIKGQIIDLPF